MRKIWTWVVCGVTFVGAGLLSGSQDAQARPGHLKGFNETYPALKEPAGELKCGICHIPGKEKPFRNDYGKALTDALGEKNVKDAAKVEAALKKVESMKSATEGKTFGDLIKDGKLPGKNP